MHVITVAQLKGGVGKTTIAVNLASEAQRLGHAVTLIDADPQGSALLWAEPKQLGFVVRQELLSLRTNLVWVRNVLKSPASLIVIDTPAGLGPNFEAIGLISDLIIVPCGPSSMDVLLAKRTIEKVRQSNRLEPSTTIRFALIPTRVDMNTDEGHQIREELALTGEAVGPHLSYNPDFVRSFATGQSISSYAPDGSGDYEVQAVGSFVFELLGQTQAGETAATQSASRDHSPSIISTK